jgi:hypothetical protein
MEPTVKPEEKYVHQSVARHLIKPSYACYCSGHRIMTIEDPTGRLPPEEPIQLYLARINCHLSHGCEISLESEDMGSNNYVKFNLKVASSVKCSTSLVGLQQTEV